MYFQITVCETHLSIIIHREAESKPDYPALTKTIREAIAPFPLPPEIEDLVLCSRVYGVSNPDWQTSIQLKQPSTEESESLTAETVESQSEKVFAPLDLSEYCFIRNLTLLGGPLVAPAAEIASSVLFFHNLPDSEKEQVLPLLEQGLKQGEVPHEDRLDPEVAQWLKEIAGFNPQQSRKASIWFSRYCHNPEQTRSELTPVLATAAPEPAMDSADPESPSPPQQEERKDFQQQTTRVPPSSPTPRTRPKGGKKRKAATKLKWLPTATIAGFFLTLFAMVSISLFQGAEVATLCLSSPSQRYCQLAVEMVGGEESLLDAYNDALPFDSDKEQQVISWCDEAVRRRSRADSLGYSNRKVNFSGEVLPGIYLRDRQLTLSKGPYRKLRVACVIKNSDTFTSIPRFLALDLIPKNWPLKRYQAKTTSARQKSEIAKIARGLTFINELTLFSLLLFLIVNVGCSAIALFLVCRTPWIKIGVSSWKAFWSTAAIWGVLEIVIFPYVRFFGFFVPFIFNTFEGLVRLIVFWGVSLFVKGLQLNLSREEPMSYFGIGVCVFWLIAELVRMTAFSLLLR